MISTRKELEAMRADAYKKHDAYIEAEKQLWEAGDGFPSLELYKVFKKAKTAFHNANEKWETALIEHILDVRK